MFDYLAAELDKLIVGHRRLGPVDVPVQHLRVFRAMLTAAADWHDMIERCCIGCERASRKGAAIVLARQ
jgi:hypothetical protein